MSYDNAEPKTLKTLNSSGQVLDDSGNVISDTTDYWEKFYEQADPKPDKILHSDGTIKDSAGNVIQDTTEFNIKKYNQAEPIPAKYLHSDGTIDENPGGGPKINLQENKNVSINFQGLDSPSTQEILPGNNYDAMKKVTLTLNEGNWYKFTSNDASPKTIYARRLVEGVVKIYLCNVDSNAVTIEKKEGSLIHTSSWLTDIWILTYNGVTYTKSGSTPDLIL